MTNTSPIRNIRYQIPEYQGQDANQPPRFAVGTRLRILNRARKFYGEEYQGELTVAGTRQDDYGRPVYTFVEYPNSSVILMEFQIEHEFQLV